MQSLMKTGYGETETSLPRTKERVKWAKKKGGRVKNLSRRPRKKSEAREKGKRSPEPIALKKNRPLGDF